MGRFAIGRRAFGMSCGVDVNVVKEAPGPHKMRAWKPGAGSVACGMAEVRSLEGLSRVAEEAVRGQEDISEN
jgi:hypothetical protein